MTQVMTILPGVILRCFSDTRFKQGCLSIQLIRKMCREEASLNALLPAVLLRGTVHSPDLRDITLRLDDLYGASVGALVRRVGDYQTTGLTCNFIEDRYALAGDQILEPMIRFLGELLLEPVLENGGFRRDYVESEKKNLIAAIEAQRNDKRVYASAQLLRHMCREDSFGIPRLGEKQQVLQIDAFGAYNHYCKILRESPIELFYVGSGAPEKVAALLKGLFERIDRNYAELPAQTAFVGGREGQYTETMEVAQGKLAMGFVTPVTIRDPGFVAMQVCNTLLGAGMTSKLFMQVREKLSLCYDISSGYHGSKGILTVQAGIDCNKECLVREEILLQLEACCLGRITPEELEAAKESICASLQGTHDSPGAIEGYYASGALSGLKMTPGEYAEAVRALTVEQVAAAARTLKLHTVYFLKGVE